MAPSGYASVLVQYLSHKRINFLHFKFPSNLVGFFKFDFPSIIDHSEGEAEYRFQLRIYIQV